MRILSIRVRGRVAVAVVLTMCLLLSVAHDAQAQQATDQQPGDLEPAPRVVNGVTTSIQEHPYVVRLALTAPNGDSFICTGSLIRPDRVLTAAHCLDGINRVKVFSEGSRTSGPRQIRNGASWAKHPQYRPNVQPSGGGYDVAVIRLASPFNLNGRTQTVNIATPAQVASADRATAVGWGSLVPGDNPRFPSRLQSVALTMRTDSFCKLFYGGGFLGARELCAGDPGKDTCGGDSGGPLVIRVDGQYKLAGVTSWGAECGTAPGVYAQLSAFRRWIFNKVPKQQCDGRPATVDVSLGMTAGAGADVIVGSARRDVIRGHAGNDLICGFGGNDFIHAGAGNDRVFAGNGNDRVVGGIGLDRLHGNRGNDVLFGGAGPDVLNGGLGGNDKCFGEAGADQSSGCEVRGSTRDASATFTGCELSDSCQLWTVAKQGPVSTTAFDVPATEPQVGAGGSSDAVATEDDMAVRAPSASIDDLRPPREPSVAEMFTPVQPRLD